MSSQYNGQPGNVLGFVGGNYQQIALINGSSNTNPVVITTASPLPAYVQSGDYVHIKGHLVNSSAEGIHQITVIDSTHFSLNGVAGVGVGGASGIVLSLGAADTYAIPSDGDDEDGASVDVGLEALGDKVSALYLATGIVSVASMQPIASGGWQADTAAANLTAWGSVVVSGVDSYTPMLSPAWGTSSFDSLCAGDVIDVEFEGNISLTAGSGGDNMGYALFAGVNAPGALATTPKLKGTQRLYWNNTLNTPIATRAKGQFVATTNGYLLIEIQAWASQNADTVSFVGDYNMRFTAYRPTARLA